MIETIDNKNISNEDLIKKINEIIIALNWVTEPL